MASLYFTIADKFDKFLEGLFWPESYDYATYCVYLFIILEKIDDCGCYYSMSEPRYVPFPWNAYVLDYLLSSLGLYCDAWV